MASQAAHLPGKFSKEDTLGVTSKHPLWLLHLPCALNGPALGPHGAGQEAPAVRRINPGASQTLPRLSFRVRLLWLSIVASGLVHTVAGVRMSFLLRTEGRVERPRSAYPCVHQGLVSCFGCFERGWNAFPLEPLRPGPPAGVPSTTRRLWMRDGAGHSPLGVEQGADERQGSLERRVSGGSSRGRRQPPSLPAKKT